MATTTPDNIQYPVNSDQVAPLASHFKNVADSTQAALNTKVSKAGDTMTGALTLNANPTNNLHAATKQYVDASNLPAGGADGQVLAKASGTDFDAEWIDNYAEKTYYLVRNNTGSTIPKGTLVAASGAEPSGRVDVEPFETTGLQDSELRVMGMAINNIGSGVNGEVISLGSLVGLDTRGSTASAIAVGDETWAEGDILYAHPTVAGKLTKVRPQHDLAVAFITVRHASTGQLAVRIVPGNFHLAWLHDVDIDEGTLTDGQALTYDDASGLWVNATPVNSLAGLSDVTLTSPVTDQVLKYNGTDWVNGTGGGGALPAGGATGKSLIKNSGTDYDASWSTLDVIGGGTGATSLTSGGYLKGAGTSAITSQTGIPATDITSGALAIARGGTGGITGAGLVPVVPASVTVTGGSASIGSNGTITFTGAANPIINGVFTSTFRNYRIMINLHASAGDHLAFRFAAGGTTNATSNYYTLGWGLSGSSGAIYGPQAPDSYARIGYVSTSFNNATYNIDVMNPQLADQTTMNLLGGYSNIGYWVRSLFNATTQFDGFQVLPQTGGSGYTGTIKIYGYN
jgi:hypothetical protein